MVVVVMVTANGFNEYLRKCHIIRQEQLGRGRIPVVGFLFALGRELVLYAQLTGVFDYRCDSVL